MSNLDPLVQIGDWYYQVVYGELWSAHEARPEHPQRLEPRLHSLLNFFLRHPDTLLAKDTLIEKVWPANEGTDAAVMRAVGALRKILGDDVRSPSYIATVSKKGYCWLAKIKPVDLLPPDAELSVNSAAGYFTAEKSSVSEQESFVATSTAATTTWRFIAATAVVVALCCASLAYVLAKYTAAPLVRLPDTITPISALSGQEYWPLLNTSHSHVVYQHQPPQQLSLNWSVQNLADLKVEQVPQAYLKLSQAVWLDEEQILYRAANEQYSCAFFRQTLFPQVQAPKVLQSWPCNQVLEQAILPWRHQWLWADVVPDSGDIVIYNASVQQAATEIRRFSHNWRQLNGMLIAGDTLYLLVQHSISSSAVYKVTLPTGKLQRVVALPYPVEQFSWWSEEQLLLSAVGRELEIFALNDNSVQRLGPLTIDLTQASRAPGQLLATQFLDYTTDIYRVTPSNLNQTQNFAPWHISNRSESRLAVSDYGTAFISERTGQAQVWLSKGRDSSQLTRLNEQQQVQQLFWHQEQLLLVLNNKLFRLQPDTGELQPYPLAIETAGRFSSCHNRLYWTALTSNGWQLFSEDDAGNNAIFNDVVDVRCAPEQGLLLQFASQKPPAIWQANQLYPLPMPLDWRQLSPEQWFSDSSGIYWLDKEEHAIKHYVWHSGQITEQNWPQPSLPLAIYSAGTGLGYAVRQRPHDTDIVWLQNRR